MEYDNTLNDSALLSQIGEEETNNIKWQLDPKEVLDEIEMQLRGIEHRPGRGLVRFRHPLMNDQGIGSIKILLRSHLSPTNALSVLKREEMYRIARDCALLTNDDLYVKGDSWGVKDEDKHLINMIVENSIFIFLTRPIDGGERDRMSRSYQYKDFSNPQQRTRSLFGGNKQEQLNDGY